MKKFLKKVCLLSSAALVALGLGMPMASATAPGAGDIGALYDGQSIIGKGDINYGFTLTLPQLKYNGQAQQLITGLTSNGVLPEGATLYLRVSNSLGTGPLEASEWVAYTGESSFEDAALKRTNIGTYHIYYYIDGGNNYEDVATTPEP